MSVADRPPTCRWVRNPVHATCTYANPPAARPGVSSTPSTPACPSSSRTRSMNGPSRPAATPRTPATNPTEQPTPSRSESSPAARPTGTWLAQVRLAACANTPGRTGPGRPPLRRLPGRGHPTGRADPRLHQVLGHDRARWGRWGLEHLPGVLGNNRHAGKAAATPRTGHRGAHHRVVRGSHLRQGDARRAGLLAGPAPDRPRSDRSVGLRGVL